MKKILLFIILSFVCLLSVVACGDDNEKTGDENTPVVELSKELRDARSYLIQLYGDGSETATAADYYCVSQVPSGDKKLPITWSVNTEKVTVSVVPEGEENAGMTLVDVTIGAEAIHYVLSAKIVGSDNSELKMEFNRVVPAAKATTIAEFIAAKDEESFAALTGVITAVNKVGASGAFILTDETGSIFCYDGLDVALGDKVTVIGQLSLYNDVFPQLAKPALAATISKDNDVKVASGTPLAVTASEIKADLSGNLTEKYAGKYLEITGYVMKNSQGYINLKATLGDTTACVNLYKNDSIALTEDLVNQQVKIYGFMRGSSSSYITIQVQGFEIVQEDLTDEQIIDRALSSITLPEEFKTAGTAALAASLGDVTFTWEILGEATSSLVISEGKLVATLGEEEVTRTVKLTATLGETTKTKEFTVTVAKKTGVEQNVVTTAPVAGVAYKVGLVHGNLENKTFFITGAMDGFYYATTEVSDDACDIYVEVVDGGYHIYTLNGEAKVYLNIVASGTHINVTYDNTAISVWTYNEEINTMVTPVDGVDYFLGTRSDKSYKTFSPCKLEYAATSFIAHFYSLQYVAPETEEPTPTPDPEPTPTPDPEPTPTPDPEPSDVVTSIADALAAAEGAKVELTGTVSDIYQAYNPQYGNISVYIKDAEGNKILAFRVTGTGAESLAIGDTIKVTGTITPYNEINQIAQGCTFEMISVHTCDYAEATCVTPATCKYCGKTTGEVSTEHNYVDGTCTICKAADPNYEGEVAELVTASKTVKALITEYGWTNTTTKQTFNLDDNVTVKVNGGSNTGKAYNGDHIRIYATDTPAGTLTISVPEGYELVSIKISTVTGTYAFLCVDGTTTDICNQTVMVSGNSVVLNSVKNGSDGKQVRVTALEVVYKAK